LSVVNAWSRWRCWSEDNALDIGYLIIGDNSFDIF
jgi:hypothetical protein